MMRNILYIISLVCATVLMWGCVDKDNKITAEQRNFLDRSVYGVYSSGSDLFVFDEQACQYAVSEKSVRVQRDDMQEYFALEFNSTPPVSGSVNTKVVVYRIKGAGREETTDLTVLRKESGMMWLWNKGKKLGYLVPWDND